MENIEINQTLIDRVMLDGIIKIDGKDYKIELNINPPYSEMSYFEVYPVDEDHEMTTEAKDKAYEMVMNAYEAGEFKKFYELKDNYNDSDPTENSIQFQESNISNEDLHNYIEFLSNQRQVGNEMIWLIENHVDEEGLNAIEDVLTNSVYET